MNECIISTILEKKVKDSEQVRIQTTSGSTYEGTLEDVDCMGVLFIAEDKSFDPAYILYTDIKKFMLPRHK
jgi:hypothetical protein